VQINPVWLYGPYNPASATTAAQPDWYLGWLEGALRLTPPLRLELFGWRMPEVVVPGTLLPLVVFALLYAWPFLERRVTGDREAHNLVDRPRDRPVRTAIGIGGLTFAALLMVAGGQDVIAVWLDIPVTSVTAALRVTVIVVPVIAAFVAWRICHELAEAEPLEEFAASGEPPVGPSEPRHVTEEPAGVAPASGDPVASGRDSG
jgi:ubiquinol-cytochrome c reductase cytochrome b subunit